MEMIKQSCEQFLAELAGKAPTPGGGGTAALVGAAGVALGSMVGSLTIGKKKYAAVEADIQALNARADILRKELEALVQADAEAFAPLAAAYGLPKDTPEQAAHKAAVLESALDAACAVPLQIMEAAQQCISHLEFLEANGSVMAVSDVGVAVQFIRTALTGAVMNVYINTKSMKQRDEAEKINQKAEKLLEEGTKRADLVYEKVLSRLKK